MPNRILRPWTDSEAVNSLSDAAEIFFIRLIMCADDCGRFYGSPQLLKSFLFPLKSKRVADISRWIAECVKAGLIADYEVDGKRYIVIPKFGQRLRILRSKFPPPPNDCQMADTCQTDGGQMTDRWQSNDCREDEVEEETRRREGENNAPPRMYDSQSFDGYPKSVDEVISIAQSPQCGMKCTREQAEIYLATRQSNDWCKASHKNRVPPGFVPADIKQWLIRDQQKRQNEMRQEKDYYASGRHISNNPEDFPNDPI